MKEKKSLAMNKIMKYVDKYHNVILIIETIVKKKGVST